MRALIVPIFAIFALNCSLAFAETKKPSKDAKPKTAPVQAKAVAPTPAAAPAEATKPTFVEEPIPAPQTISPMCTALLAGLKMATPSALQTDEAIREKRALELANGAAVAEQNQLVRIAQVTQMQTWERLMFLVARGAKEEALQMLRPNYYATMDSVKILMDIEKQLEGVTENSPEWIALRSKFEAASVPFGENYGLFNQTMQSLLSIQAGKGTNLNAIVAAVSTSDKNQMVLDLTSDTAKKTADYILKVLNLDNERKWLPNAPADTQPAFQDIQFQFRNNIFALIASLKQDNEEQTGLQSKWIRTVGFFADLYLNGTAKIHLPESARQVVLYFVGIAYDQIMQRRYLDKIQAVVSVARLADQQGNIVLTSDQTVMDLQIKTLREYLGTSTGNDLLITFARLAYHTESWAHLMAAVKAKADAEAGNESATGSKMYSVLLARMKDAETRAAAMNDLPYVYPENYPSQLRFALGNMALAIGGSTEFTQHIGWPLLHAAMRLVGI